MAKITSLCKDCGKEKARILFAEEPIYAVTHGRGGIPLCRGCYIKRCEAEMNHIKGNIQKQKALLKKEKCRKR